MKKVFIHPTAEVSSRASIGENTRVWNNAQIREEAVIGENCTIGKDVYIDKGVRIGNRVKIQNGVSVYGGVTVEDDVFLGPYCVLTNDLYPRAFNQDWQVVQTHIKKGASLGANSTIVCGKTIGTYAMVGAGAVVTRDVPDFALVLGNPARVAGYVCICGEVLQTVDAHPAEKVPRIGCRCKKCGLTLS